MTLDGLVSIGKITKLHGYRGEVLAFFDIDEIDAALQLKSVFVVTDTSSLPYRIEKISLKKGKLFRLKLSSIDSEEKAKGLLKATILIEEKLIPTLIDEDPDSKMEGYAVVDKVHGELGRVSYVGGNEVNPLLVIEKDGYELIIPLNDEFVLSVDDEKHLIEVSTPEGLLDLNS